LTSGVRCAGANAASRPRHHCVHTTFGTQHAGTCTLTRRHGRYYNAHSYDTTPNTKTYSEDDDDELELELLLLEDSSSSLRVQGHTTQHIAHGTAYSSRCERELLLDEELLELDDDDDELLELDDDDDESSSSSSLQKDTSQHGRTDARHNVLIRAVQGERAGVGVDNDVLHVDVVVIRTTANANVTQNNTRIASNN
jgi:hypothetical protein